MIWPPKLPSNPMRMRLLIFPLLGLLGFPLGSNAEGRAWLDSVGDAVAKAREADQLILVDLYADWCGWCKKLEQEVFSTPTFEEFARDFVLLRVDTEDGGEGTVLQQKFEAYNLPTTLVLDSAQVKVGEVMGFAPTDRFVAAIQREIESFNELVRGFERFGETSDIRVLGILAEEFHQRNDGERAALLYRQILATGELTEDRAIFFQYQLTDTLRLAGRYEEALKELRETRLGAVHLGKTDLVEHLDLQAAQIALDSGDCRQAETALEEFLGSYGKSQLRQQARRTLASIRADGFQQCL
jgi:thiol-disulfide isomerase/thioredoxin